MSTISDRIVPTYSLLELALDERSPDPEAIAQEFPGLVRYTQYAYGICARLNDETVVGSYSKTKHLPNGKKVTRSVDLKVKDFDLGIGGELMDAARQLQLADPEQARSLILPVVTQAAREMGVSMVKAQVDGQNLVTNAGFINDSYQAIIDSADKFRDEQEALFVNNPRALLGLGHLACVALVSKPDEDFYDGVTVSYVDMLGISSGRGGRDILKDIIDLGKSGELDGLMLGSLSRAYAISREGREDSLSRGFVMAEALLDTTDPEVVTGGLLKIRSGWMPNFANEFDSVRKRWISMVESVRDLALEEARSISNDITMTPEEALRKIHDLYILYIESDKRARKAFIPPKLNDAVLRVKTRGTPSPSEQLVGESGANQPETGQINDKESKKNPPCDVYQAKLAEKGYVFDRIGEGELHDLIEEYAKGDESVSGIVKSLVEYLRDNPFNENSKVLHRLQFRFAGGKAPMRRFSPQGIDGLTGDSKYRTRIVYAVLPPEQKGEPRRLVLVEILDHDKFNKRYNS